MLQFLHFSLSCIGIIFVAGLAIAVVAYFGRRSPVPRTDREIISEMREMTLDNQLKYLSSASVQQRLCAVAILGESKDARVVQSLKGVLDDSDPQVSDAALKMLARMDTPDSVNAFLHRLNEDANITYHPGLFSQPLKHGGNDLLAWLIRQVRKGNLEAISLIADYDSPHTVAFLVTFLKDESVPLWDRRREEVAKHLANKYLENGLSTSEKRVVELLNQVVWMDLRPQKAEMAATSSGRSRPTEMRMKDFIRLQSSVS